MRQTLIIALILAFVVVSVGAYGLGQLHPRYDVKALMLGNVVMFGISLIAGLLATKSVHDRPQVFVRGVFSGNIVKLFACIIGLTVYVLMNKATLYKPMVFCLLGIYAVYSIAGTWAASRTAKKVA